MLEIDKQARFYTLNMKNPLAPLPPIPSYQRRPHAPLTLGLTEALETRLLYHDHIEHRNPKGSMEWIDILMQEVAPTRRGSMV